MESARTRVAQKCILCLTVNRALCAEGAAREKPLMERRVNSALHCAAL